MDEVPVGAEDAHEEVAHHRRQEDIGQSLRWGVGAQAKTKGM